MSPQKAPGALRTIGEVAEHLGVATHVLRFWESKFKQIKPQKRRGRRYYRPEDIRTIEQIKSLLYTQGLTIKGAQKFLNENKSLLTSFSVEDLGATLIDQTMLKSTSAQGYSKTPENQNDQAKANSTEQEIDELKKRMADLRMKMEA